MAIFDAITHKILKKSGAQARHREKPDLYRAVLRGAGLFLGHISLLGGVSSFGLAFLTIERRASLYAVLNYALGILGSLWLFRDLTVIKYALAGGIYLLFLFARSGDKPLRLLDSAFLITISLLIGGCLFMFWSGFEIPSLVMLLCECFACLSTVVVLDIIRGAIIERRFDPSRLSTEEKGGFLAAAALAVLSLRQIELFGVFEPATSAVCFVILLVSSSAGAGASAAIAAVLGLMCGIGGENILLLIGSLCVFALISGMLRRYGRIVSSAGAVLGCAALGFAYGDILGAPLSLIGAAAAAVLQIIVPTRVYSVISEIFTPSAPVLISENNPEPEAKRRLFEAARSFKSLSETLVLPKENGAEGIESASEIFDGAADIVCRRCTNCGLCWQKDYSATYTAMCRFFGVLESRGTVSPEDAPGDFAERCLHLRPFTRELNRLYEIGRHDRVWRKRMNENRVLASEQLGFAAEILEKLSLEAEQTETVDLRLKNEFALKMRLSGIKVRETHIIRRASGRLSAEITAVCRRDTRGMCGRILSSAKALLSPCMQVSEVERLDRKTVKICLTEGETLTAKVGFAARGAETVSGDRYAVTKLSDGKIAITVSDGMGTGESASEDSGAIVKLLSDFLRAGFDKNLAVRLVNSVMVMNSAREAFATVDMCVIDLYSGEVEFMKTGAEPSYIRKDGQVEIVRAASLPVGMFPSVEPECFARTVGDGDYIVMTTDGVATKTGGGAWLKEYLENADCTSPKKLASDLLDRAVEKNGGQVQDDITVIAIEVSAQTSEVPNLPQNTA